MYHGGGEQSCYFQIERHKYQSRRFYWFVLGWLPFFCRQVWVFHNSFMISRQHPYANVYYIQEVLCICLYHQRQPNNKIFGIILLLKWTSYWVARVFCNTSRCREKDRLKIQQDSTATFSKRLKLQLDLGGRNH